MTGHDVSMEGAKAGSEVEEGETTCRKIRIMMGRRSSNLEEGHTQGNQVC